MMKGRRFILKQNFEGLPKPEDFELVEEELPELQDGEFLFRLSNNYLSWLRRNYRNFRVESSFLGM